MRGLTSRPERWAVATHASPGDATFTVGSSCRQGAPRHWMCFGQAPLPPWNSTGMLRHEM